MPVSKDFLPIAGASGQGDTTYAINQSIRFNDDDNAYLTKSFGSAGDRKTYTFSWWHKIGSKSGSSSQYVIHTDLAGGNSADYLYFYDDKFYSWNQPTGQMLVTNRLFRDSSAWYHFVFVHDSTQAVSKERLRFYVNGERQTSFSTENYPSLNYASGYFNNNQSHYIGGANSLANRFDGYIAELHFLDGYGYGPEYFGEFKEDTDIWIPKEYTGSYGSNGFKIDGRDSSDLGDDESGNGNDFTATNLAANDQVLDSPTNNFCVMSPLANQGSPTYAEGNLKVTMTSGVKKGAHSSFAISSGKWYVEGRLTSSNNGSQYAYVGIEDYNSAINSGQYIGRDTYGYSYDPANGGVLHNNSYVVSSGTLASLAQNDIVQIAVDLDNNYIYWGKNGTFLNSGDPTSGSSGTGGVSVIAASSQPSGHYHIGHSNGTGSSGYQSEIVWNFGQEGTFAGGTSAGGNKDSNGIGNFKYSVPSGFLALCTKNLGS
jgi:hypothetical protein